MELVLVDDDVVLEDDVMLKASCLLYRCNLLVMKCRK